MLNDFQMEDFIPQFIFTLIAILLLWIAKHFTGKVIQRYGMKMQKAEIRRNHIRQVISILLNIMVVIVIAIIWGVNPRNLMLAISSTVAVLGVALFAQWSVLSNVTAGIIMFFGAPYKIGDHIRILDKDAPIEAVIENIQTFYTHIRTYQNELIVIPNNIFLQKIVSLKEPK